MKFGCCITNLDDLITVEKNGFDYAEVSVTDILIPSQDKEKWEKNEQIIRKSKLPIEVANSFLDIKIIGENLNYKTIRTYLKNTFTRANSIGIKVVGFGSGRARTIPDIFPKKRADYQLKQFLDVALEYAQQYDIYIGLEPLNKEETNFINYLTEAQQIIKRIANPYLKLTADFYHMNMENEKMEKLKEVERELIHIHVADTHRKHPGLGNYNFRELFTVLEKIGYDSRVSIECDWNSSEKLKEALNFLQGVSP